MQSIYIDKNFFCNCRTITLIKLRDKPRKTSRCTGSGLLFRNHGAVCISDPDWVPIRVRACLRASVAGRVCPGYFPRRNFTTLKPLHRFESPWLLSALASQHSWTRTANLRIWRPTPYPFGHRANCTNLRKEFMPSICTAREASLFLV